MSNKRPLLQLEHVDKSFGVPSGRVEILTDVCFDVPEGEFVVITGPSGSGKTTLLNIAALLDRPTRGRVLFDGTELAWQIPATVRNMRKQKVGMVFQNFHLLRHRSARDNVIFRCRYLGGRPTDYVERASELLCELGLEKVMHQPARLLSGGEMQRVAIARAMMHEPRLLVADEPTGNLDKRSASVVMDALTRFHRRGTTVLLVTHNHALLPYATCHYECDAGTLIECGT